ncbi:hypothetical protein pW2_20 [Bacillus phage pW2]|uniref:Uncharacterized protein n=1 Tax=Bacillus phage pW2 TaxID=2500559 RepID=A0A3Q9R7B4_9CAUD|nr:hypothetical protein PQE69_gp007 [Bacillus phage pW2]AZU98860.1 hypothetical protein pW2_20 [Bacillus phage pW2]
MMKDNEIHKRYPQFGKAQTEDKLIEEAMRAEVIFGKKVKVVMNPEYYKKYFKDAEPSKETLEKIKKTKGGYWSGVAGYNIETSTLVDTYIFEFEVY